MQDRLEQAAEKTRGGWIRSGDLAYRDADGYFFFVDRKNDFMRRRGENISSFEVEKIINGHPSVLESASDPPMGSRSGIPTGDSVTSPCGQPER